ncbi:unnamed protein product [Prorocentrum cordatum]|uniref:Tyr recombinase domain-containing protein n=1 Tax=Prorocentrum cordatum TaxID=2364126 RepID=A0ABN9UY99_9DINO|nr:unnamed protein product [Polarella glacialis]
MLIRAAEEEGDIEQAALIAVSRLLLLRAPSEAIPLQIHGGRSAVSCAAGEVVVVLNKRKHLRAPTTLRRMCCRASSGRLLCAYQWMKKALAVAATEKRKSMFTKTRGQFVNDFRRHATAAGIPDGGSLGTHCLRRGVARDILDAGGSLSVLLLAGDWRSAAFVRYLRTSQLEDAANSRLVIDHSDSE